MKRRDVPGDVGRYAGNEIGGGLQFIIRIIEAGNDERDDLHPEAALINQLDSVEDIFQQAAELAIVAVVEAFEIDLVKLRPRAYVVEHFRCGIAVRDISANESCGPGLLEHFDG